MVESSLLTTGRHYDLLINWNRRIKLEIPFIEYFLKNFGQDIRNILEVGCGTGYHAKALTDLGYKITGIDINESMIEQARLRAKNAKFHAMDFLEPSTVIKTNFEAIISLGNSIGLITSASNFEEVVSRFPQYLNPSKSILIFQLLNTEKEREGWSNPRTVINEDGEFVFLRGFSTSKNYIHPEILTLFRAETDKEWSFHSTGKANIPRISKKDITSLLKIHGFYEIQIFGNYQRDQYDSGTSIDMIVVAKF
ncbi:MAG: class I SAM-dependent methyltransferase [Candidatus Hodarchaeales archaeon]|jgi:SAM-dependent methyltransferase